MIRSEKYQKVLIPETTALGFVYDAPVNFTRGGSRGTQHWRQFAKSQSANSRVCRKGEKKPNSFSLPPYLRQMYYVAGY